MERTPSVLDVQAMRVHHGNVQEVPEESKPPASRSPVDGVVRLLLVILINGTHEAIVPWHYWRARDLLHYPIHFPFPGHGHVSGRRLCIGDEVDVLVVLPNRQGHTPL